MKPPMQVEKKVLYASTYFRNETIMEDDVFVYVFCMSPEFFYYMAVEVEGVYKENVNGLHIKVG